VLEVLVMHPPVEVDFGFSKDGFVLRGFPAASTAGCAVQIAMRQFCFKAKSP
jgi:hypothetical protein